MIIGLILSLRVLQQVHILVFSTCLLDDLRQSRDTSTHFTHTHAGLLCMVDIFMYKSLQIKFLFCSVYCWAPCLYPYCLTNYSKNNIYSIIIQQYYELLLTVSSSLI